MKQSSILLIFLSHALLANEPAEETFDKLTNDFTSEVGEHFTFIDAKIQFDPTFQNRYWLATMEAKSAGKFVLQVDLKRDLEEPSVQRDEQYKFELTVAERGTSRLVIRSNFRAWHSPLACVGDRVVLPIRFNTNDHSHRFKLQKANVLARTTVDDYLSMKEKHSRVIAVESLKLKNTVSDELELIAARTNSFSNASKTTWYHNLDTVFRVSKAGKLNAKAYFPWRSGPGRASQFSLDILDKDEPITVTLGFWKLFFFKDGRKGERGAMQVGERVTPLRVGDMLWVSSPESPSSKSSKGYKFPTLTLEKQPFGVTNPIFIDSIPSDTTELE